MTEEIQTKKVVDSNGFWFWLGGMLFTTTFVKIDANWVVNNFDADGIWIFVYGAGSILLWPMTLGEFCRNLVIG